MTGLQALWVPGPLPGLNEIIDAAKGAGGRGLRYAKLKKKWTNDIALLAKVAKLRPVRTVKLRFVWQEKDRRRNPDNIAAGGRKLVLDGLVLAGVLGNDGWQEIAGFIDQWRVSPQTGVYVFLEPALISTGPVDGDGFETTTAKGVFNAHGAVKPGAGEANEGDGPPIGPCGGGAGDDGPRDHPVLDLREAP